MAKSKKHRVKGFSKGRALYQAAKNLRGLDIRANANEGLDSIVASIANYQQRPLPQSKLERWNMLMAFIGHKVEPKPKRQKIGAAQIHEAERKARRTGAPASSDEFLQTYEWRRVRMLAIKKYGRKCQCCGASPDTGAVINVDHIRPRRLFPELALELDNLQVLCGECNHGKGNWDMTDWRPSEAVADPEQMAHLREILN